jgi:hypothetical protein
MTRARLAAFAAAAAALLAAPAAHAAQPVYIPTYKQESVLLAQHPASDFPISRDLHMGMSFTVTHAKWRSWGKFIATATVTGTVTYNGIGTPTDKFKTTLQVTDPDNYGPCAVTVYTRMSFAPIINLKNGKVIADGGVMQGIGVPDPDRCP